MATTTFSCAPTNATDASFRDWGSKLSAAIQAVGFVKTADTGQINWTTVLRPPSTNTAQGYEIFRFNDALQATAPIYLKAVYGTASTTNCPWGRIFVGSGSDGTGTLTGEVTTFPFSIVCTALSASSFNCYVTSGDGSMLGICMWQNGSALIPNAGVIERSRGADGAPNGNSAFIAYSYCPTTPAIISILSDRPTGAIVTSSFVSFWPNSPPALTTGLASGSSAPMFPMSTVDPNGNWAYPRGLLAYMKPDAAAAIPVTVPGYGTYLPLGNAVADGILYPAQQSSLAMRWE